jgi:hypothetical protein
VVHYRVLDLRFEGIALLRIDQNDPHRKQSLFSSDLSWGSLPWLVIQLLLWLISVVLDLVLVFVTIVIFADYRSEERTILVADYPTGLRRTRFTKYTNQERQ